MANTMMEGTKARDWANVGLTVAVFLSPWIMGFAIEAIPSWNASIAGLLLGGLAMAAVLAFAEWEEWARLGVGLWLAASPWLLGFTANANATWTCAVLGLAVAAVSVWAVWDNRHPHAHA